MFYERDGYWEGQTWSWGGPTARFRDSTPVYAFIRRFLDQKAETAMWGRHIDEEAIVKGLRVATGAPAEDVILWLTQGESRADYRYRFEHALRCWGIAGFRKNYLPYYFAVRETMSEQMERHDVSGIQGCMKRGASVEYVAYGRQLGYSWSIIQFGAENGIAMEYLGEVIVQPEDKEED